jgi:adenylate cyclase
MNAPPNIDPATAHDVVNWLTNDTRDERFIDNIFAELSVPAPASRHSHQAGVAPCPDPQWLGARIMWADGMREGELRRVDHDVRERSEYINSLANEQFLVSVFCVYRF